jgi:hypothetical protein
MEATPDRTMARSALAVPRRQLVFLGLQHYGARHAGGRGAQLDAGRNGAIADER